MKPWIWRAGVIAAAVLVLGAVNATIFGKERIKAHGERVYLALAPVDPRSLMQGDYMALDFEIARRIPAYHEGSAPLIVHENGIATLDPDPASHGLRIRYRIRNGRVWLGTNAYFFEEGSAERYQGVHYGEFRVDRASGEAVLVGLTGDDLQRR